MFCIKRLTPDPRDCVSTNEIGKSVGMLFGLNLISYNSEVLDYSDSRPSTRYFKKRFKVLRHFTRVFLKVNDVEFCTPNL